MRPYVAVFWEISALQAFLYCDEFHYTIDHILYALHLGHAKSSFVADVVDTAFALGVFSVDASDLEVVSVGDGFEGFHVGCQFGEFDVDTGSHGGA